VHRYSADPLSTCVGKLWKPVVSKTPRCPSEPEQSITGSENLACVRQPFAAVKCHRRGAFRNTLATRSSCSGRGFTECRQHGSHGSIRLFAAVLDDRVALARRHEAYGREHDVPSRRGRTASITSQRSVGVVIVERRPHQLRIAVRVTPSRKCKYGGGAKNEAARQSGGAGALPCSR